MTREEAIERYDRIRYNLLNREDKAAVDVAFDALREQEARGKGCEYCLEYKSIVEENGDFISLDETGAKGIFLEACTCDVVLEAKVQFCPMCGRRLEEA